MSRGPAAPPAADLDPIALETPLGLFTGPADVPWSFTFDTDSPSYAGQTVMLEEDAPGDLAILSGPMGPANGYQERDGTIQTYHPPLFVTSGAADDPLPEAMTPTLTVLRDGVALAPQPVLTLMPDGTFQFDDLSISGSYTVQADLAHGDVTLSPVSEALVVAPV